MFAEYLKLGTGHILDPNGIDHVLFLIALVIAYNYKEWKGVIVLATAFTIGHSVTLVLAALDVVAVSSKLIEIFIAVSIAITALFNILKPDSDNKARLRYPTAFIFGLIHGLGFSNFFKTILGKDNIVQPLLAFNIGVELAQVIIVLLVLLVSYLLTSVLKMKKRHLVIGTSIIIFLYSIKLVLERI